MLMTGDSYDCGKKWVHAGICEVRAAQPEEGAKFRGNIEQLRMNSINNRDKWLVINTNNGSEHSKRQEVG